MMTKSRISSGSTFEAEMAYSRAVVMMISAGLIDPRMKIEIEVTARRSF